MEGALEHLQFNLLFLMAGKPPRMETAQPLQATHSAVWLSSAENISPYI